MPHPRHIGRAFEDRAASYLVELGYTLVTRRYSCKGGEIDLIAMDGDEFVFVEVKASRSKAMRAGEFLDHKKEARLMTAIAAYQKEMETGHLPCRIDVITFDGDVMQHHKNAEWTV